MSSCCFLTLSFSLAIVCNSLRLARWNIIVELNFNIYLNIINDHCTIPINILKCFCLYTEMKGEIPSHHHSLAIILIMHAVTDFPMADRSPYVSEGGLLKDRYTRYTRNGPGWLWSTVSPPSRSFRQPDCPKQRAGTEAPLTFFGKNKPPQKKHTYKKRCWSIKWGSFLALDHGTLDEWWRYGFTWSVDHDHFFPPVSVTSVPV